MLHKSMFVLFIGILKNCTNSIGKYNRCWIHSDRKCKGKNAQGRKNLHNLLVMQVCSCFVVNSVYIYGNTDYTNIIAEIACCVVCTTAIQNEQRIAIWLNIKSLLTSFWLVNVNTRINKYRLLFINRGSC